MTPEQLTAERPRLMIKSLDGRFTKDSECVYVRCDWCNQVGIALNGRAGHQWFSSHSERCLQ